jgi:pimeloyl-ACP methyl ester carboxylesterase
MKLTATIKDELHTKRFVIPYRVYGNGGPHLVCLNGVQQSMAMWHGFIRRFAPRYRIVLFNFPGQGKGRVLYGSTKASLEEELEIMHEVIKATDVNDITFCTASWGGVVAMVYAEKYPHMVKRLILGSLTTRANKHMLETIQSGIRIDTNDRRKIADNLINSIGQKLPEVIKRRIIRQFATLREEQLRAFFEHGLFISGEKNLKDVVNFNEIQAETILLNGENDTIIDLDDVKYLASQLPDCRMEIVRDVGHFLHLESDDVLDFYHRILP